MKMLELFASVSLLLNACAAPQESVWPACEVGSGVIVVQGQFDASGSELLELKPIQRYDYTSPPLPCQADGRFLLEIEAEAGTKYLFFDALVADDSGNTRRGFFELTLPVQTEIKRLRILDVESGKAFTDQTNPIK